MYNKYDKSELYYDRGSVSQSVVTSGIHLGPMDRFLLLSVAGLLMWGALSDERTGLWFTTAAGPHHCVHSRVRVPQDSSQI
jgi:hypothetical protein